MNKRGTITFLFVFLATLISFYFMTFTSRVLNISSISMIALLFIIPLTIFMYQELKHIRNQKLKFIYDVILMLLTLFSIGIIIFLGIAFTSCSFTSNCSYDISNISIIIYIPVLLSIFLLNIPSVFGKTNKLNDYLTIITSIIVILIHIRYYNDSNLLNNIYPNSNNQDYFIFIYQNYIYFIIMYITVIIHKFINKVS